MALWLFENNFDGRAAHLAFAAGWPQLPIAVVLPYLFVVRYGPRWMQHRPPFVLREVSRFWNCSLALFSIGGAYVCIPHLMRQLWTHGFHFCACADVYEIAGYGPPALWAAAFSWSKLFELFDTVLLILKKRKVITLHWFHHSSVIFFVWAAWTYEVPLALWYGTMNYTVHSVMYSYFALTSSLHWRATALRFAPLITTLQISQFGFATVLNIYAAGAYMMPSIGCSIRPPILYLSAALYMMYGALFVHLFVRRYMKPQKEAREAAEAWPDAKEKGERAV